MSPTHALSHLFVATAIALTLAGCSQPKNVVHTDEASRIQEYAELKKCFQDQLQKAGFVIDPTPRTLADSYAATGGTVIVTGHPHDRPSMGNANTDRYHRYSTTYVSIPLAADETNIPNGNDAKRAFEIFHNAGDDTVMSQRNTRVIDGQMETYIPDQGEIKTPKPTRDLAVQIGTKCLGFTFGSGAV